jgi:hypothetical protein
MSDTLAYEKSHYVTSPSDEPTFRSGCRYVGGCGIHSRTSRRFLLVRCYSSRVRLPIPESLVKRLTSLLVSQRNWSSFRTPAPLTSTTDATYSVRQAHLVFQRAS